MDVRGVFFEYASNAVVYWPVETLRSHFEQRCERSQLDVAAELSTLCGPELDADDFWSRVHTNLQAGRVRLIIVWDEITSELRRIVEFLNAQLTTGRGGRQWDEASFFAALQERGADEVDVVARIIHSIHESRTLMDLRDTLLPKLISGELRVKDAERVLAKANI